jgi:uncharacterized membrane protein YedE/YeeE
MHRADFCLTCAFREPFLFRSFFMTRIVGFAVLLTAVWFEILRLSGAVPSVAGGPPVWGNLAGGILFGIGMVLAGGCVVGTLYRMGAGNMPALAAFAGLLLGSAVYAELYPVLSPLAATTLGTRATTLPELLGLPPFPVVAAVLIPCAWLYARWARHGVLSRPGFARGYLAPWKAAAILSILSAAALLSTGMPLAITTFYAKLAAWGEAVFVPGHVASLDYFSIAPFRLTTPWGVKLSGGAGPVLDSLAALQGPTVLGIVGGAFLSAVTLGEFKVYSSVPKRQYAMALAGGVLMALGSRLGLGCNVWYVLGAVPAFKLQGILFVLGLVPGSWAGARLFAAVV